MTPKQKQDIATRLKDARNSVGETQEHVAAELNVDQPVVSYYESGNSEPAWNYLEYLFKTHHISADYILYGEPPMYRFTRLEELKKPIEGLKDGIIEIYETLYGKGKQTKRKRAK